MARMPRVRWPARLVAALPNAAARAEPTQFTEQDRHPVEQVSAWVHETGQAVSVPTIRGTLRAAIMPAGGPGRLSRSRKGGHHVGRLV